MKTLRLFPLELGRLLRSRLTWLVVLLTVLSPAAGLILYKPAYADTMLSMYLANPALAGGVIGGILFALLTIFELDRARRSRTEVLTDAVVSPHAMALVRLLALLISTMTPIDLLVLDEHTAALDPRSSETVMELTDRIVREKQLTAIMVTHNLRFAVEYGTRLCSGAAFDIHSLVVNLHMLQSGHIMTPIMAHHHIAARNGHRKTALVLLKASRQLAVVIVYLVRIHRTGLTARSRTLSR